MKEHPHVTSGESPLKMAMTLHKIAITSSDDSVAVDFYARAMLDLSNLCRMATDGMRELAKTGDKEASELYKKLFASLTQFGPPSFGKKTTPEKEFINLIEKNKEKIQSDLSLLTPSKVAQDLFHHV